MDAAKKHADAGRRRIAAAFARFSARCASIDTFFFVYKGFVKKNSVATCTAHTMSSAAEGTRTWYTDLRVTVEKLHSRKHCETNAQFVFDALCKRLEDRECREEDVLNVKYKDTLKVLDGTDPVNLREIVNICEKVGGIGMAEFNEHKLDRLLSSMLTRLRVPNIAIDIAVEGKVCTVIIEQISESSEKNLIVNHNLAVQGDEVINFDALFEAVAYALCYKPEKMSSEDIHKETQEYCTLLQNEDLTFIELREYDLNVQLKYHMHVVDCVDWNSIIDKRGPRKFDANVQQAVTVLGKAGLECLKRAVKKDYNDDNKNFLQLLLKQLHADVKGSRTAEQGNGIFAETFLNGKKEYAPMLVADDDIDMATQNLLSVREEVHEKQLIATPLMLAVAYGSHETVDALIKHNILPINNPAGRGLATHEDLLSLHHYCEYPMIPQEGVHTGIKKGMCAVMLAAQCQNSDIVAAILQADYDTRRNTVEHLNAYDAAKTVLMYTVETVTGTSPEPAIDMANDIVKKFFRYVKPNNEVSENQITLRTAFEEACSRNLTKIVGTFLKLGSINANGEDLYHPLALRRQSPLLSACTQLENVRTIAYLLAPVADPVQKPGADPLRRPNGDGTQCAPAVLSNVINEHLHPTTFDEATGAELLVSAEEIQLIMTCVDNFQVTKMLCDFIKAANRNRVANMINYQEDKPSIILLRKIVCELPDRASTLRLKTLLWQYFPELWNPLEWDGSDDHPQASFSDTCL